MNFKASQKSFALSRSWHVLAGLTVSSLLLCLSVVFLYAGQVQLGRNSANIFVEQVNQNSLVDIASLRNGFLNSSKLVMAVRERDFSVLGRQFDEFRKGYSGVALLLTDRGEPVFEAGDVREGGTNLKGRLVGGRFQVGQTSVLYDDLGRAMPDLKATFWLEISHVFQNLDSLSEGATLVSEARRGALPVMDGIWLLLPSAGQLFLSIFKTPAYLALLGFQWVVSCIFALLGFSCFDQCEGRYHRVISLAGILEEKDPYTMGHSDRVARLAESIARKMGVRGRALQKLKLAAMVHDIGKIFVPAGILNKPGSLTAEEWEFIRRHPVDSERIFRKLLPNKYVPRVIRSHHERWDGKGYPDGLAGEEIPLAARIVAVADTFDAMTSKRPYRDAMAVVEALRVIRKNAGSQFDPKVVRSALEVLQRQDRGVSENKRDFAGADDTESSREVFV